MVLLAFILASPGVSYAQLMNLPTPGTMLGVSPSFAPPLIKGLMIHPDNPLQFDFLIDPGSVDFKGKTDQEKTDEYSKLIKYFLASLTVPEEELWVNLSPYEKDRIISENFGKTEMGRDLLGQDYILKQLAASLMYPEKELGKKFWQKVYKEAQAKFGTIDIPVNTFNKVWIIPDSASVYEKDNTVFLVESHLKVMLEEDYVALGHNSLNKEMGTNQLDKKDVQGISSLSSKVVREVIIPAIEKEVNEGKNFALLRQINNSLILATWYKTALKESLLGKVYVDRNKTDGVDQADIQDNQKIYQQYLEAFKKGVYNYIKEEYDPVSEETIPRKYFSGGFGLKDPTDGISLAGHIKRLDPVRDVAMISDALKKTVGDKVTVNLKEAGVQGQQAGSPDPAMTAVTVDSLKKELAVVNFFLGRLRQLESQILTPTASVPNAVNIYKQFVLLKIEDFINQGLDQKMSAGLIGVLNAIGGRDIRINDKFGIEVSPYLSTNELERNENMSKRRAMINFLERLSHGLKSVIGEKVPGQNVAWIDVQAIKDQVADNVMGEEIRRMNEAISRLDSGDPMDETEREYLQALQRNLPSLEFIKILTQLINLPDRTMLVGPAVIVRPELMVTFTDDEDRKSYSVDEVLSAIGYFLRVLKAETPRSVETKFVPMPKSPPRPVVLLGDALARDVGFSYNEQAMRWEVPSAKVAEVIALLEKIQKGVEKKQEDFGLEGIISLKNEDRKWVAGLDAADVGIPDIWYGARVTGRDASRFLREYFEQALEGSDPGEVGVGISDVGGQQGDSALGGFETAIWRSPKVSMSVAKLLEGISSREIQVYVRNITVGAGRAIYFVRSKLPATDWKNDSQARLRPRNQAMLGKANEIDLAEALEGKFSQWDNLSGRYSFSADSKIVVSKTKFDKILYPVIMEMIKNAADEPVGGQIKITLTKTSQGEITFSITNDKGIDWSTLREQALNYTQDGNMLRLVREDNIVFVSLSNESMRTRSPEVDLSTRRYVSADEVRGMSNEEIFFMSGIGRKKSVARGERGGTGLGTVQIKEGVEKLRGHIKIDSDKSITTISIILQQNELVDTAMLFEDKAMISQTPVGGIDLNPANLNLQIKRDGKGVPLPLPMQDIPNINVNGFIPVIINIQPIPNLPQLLGASLTPQEKQPQLSRI